MLDFCKVVLLVRAAGSQSYSTFFFSVVAEERLLHGFCNRGPAIGRDFFQKMADLELKYKEESMGLPGLHFQANQINVCTEEDWIHHVNIVTDTFLRMWNVEESVC